MDRLLQFMAHGDSTDMVVRTLGPPDGGAQPMQGLWHNEKFMLLGPGLDQGVYTIYGLQRTHSSLDGVTCSLGEDAIVIPKAPHTPTVWSQAFELCAGLGGIARGAQALGIRTVAQNDRSPLALEALQANFGHTVPGDIGQREVRIKIHQAYIRNPAMLTAGFPCQPFSRQGDGKGLADSRGKTLHHIVKITWHLQVPALILECVTEAGQNAEVQRILNELAFRMDWQKAAVVLELARQWASRRLRWWCVMLPSAHPPLGIPDWPEDRSTSTVRALLPDFPLWTPEEEAALRWTRQEEQYYMDPAYGSDHRRLVMDEPAPTALHSWGNALTACPCGCRSAGFSETRLRQGGLRGFGIWSERLQGFRFPHPVEVGLLNTMPLYHVHPGSPRSAMCLEGQLAAPLQSLWVLAHTQANAAAHLGLTPPKDPLTAMQEFKNQLRSTASLIHQVPTVLRSLAQDLSQHTVHAAGDTSSPQTASASMPGTGLQRREPPGRPAPSNTPQSEFKPSVLPLPRSSPAPLGTPLRSSIQPEPMSQGVPNADQARCDLTRPSSGLLLHPPPLRSPVTQDSLLAQVAAPPVQVSVQTALLQDRAAPTSRSAEAASDSCSHAPAPLGPSVAFGQAAGTPPSGLQRWEPAGRPALLPVLPSGPDAFTTALTTATPPALRSGAPPPQLRCFAAQVSPSPPVAAPLAQVPLFFPAHSQDHRAPVHCLADAALESRLSAPGQPSLPEIHQQAVPQAAQREPHGRPLHTQPPAATEISDATPTSPFVAILAPNPAQASTWQGEALSAQIPESQPSGSPDSFSTMSPRRLTNAFEALSASPPSISLTRPPEASTLPTSRWEPHGRPAAPALDLAPTSDLFAPASQLPSEPAPSFADRRKPHGRPAGSSADVSIDSSTMASHDAWTSQSIDPPGRREPHGRPAAEPAASSGAQSPAEADRQGEEMHHSPPVDTIWLASSEITYPVAFQELATVRDLLHAEGKLRDPGQRLSLHSEGVALPMHKRLSTATAPWQLSERPKKQARGSSTAGIRLTVLGDLGVGHCFAPIGCLCLDAFAQLHLSQSVPARFLDTQEEAVSYTHLRAHET